jgi:hypothetical protein
MRVVILGLCSIGILGLSSVAAVAAGPVRSLGPGRDTAVRFQQLHAFVERTHGLLEQAAPVPVPDALKALSKMTQAFNADQKLTLEGWKKRVSDMVRVANLLGKAILAVAKPLPAGETATAVNAVGYQLVAMTAVGSGDLNYWVERARLARDKGQRACSKVKELADTITENVPTLPLATFVRSMASLTRGVDHGGIGELEYWLATAEGSLRLARSIGDTLGAVVADPTGPVTSSLKELADQLSSIPFSGNGDVNYWRNRCSELGQMMSETGRSLRNLADGLEAHLAAR